MRGCIELETSSGGLFWKWKLVPFPLMYVVKIEAKNFYGSEEAARMAGIAVANLLGLEIVE